MYAKITSSFLDLGRCLSRGITCPSNGSFNPFIISNKEAHIVHGNINSELPKSWKKNTVQYVIVPILFVDTWMKGQMWEITFVWWPTGDTTLTKRKHCNKNYNCSCQSWTLLELVTILLLVQIPNPLVQVTEISMKNKLFDGTNFSPSFLY